MPLSAGRSLGEETTHTSWVVALVWAGIAVLLFTLALVWYVWTLPTSANLGISKPLYLATRVLAFAILFAVLELGVVLVVGGNRQRGGWLGRAVSAAAGIVLAGLAVAGIGVLVLFSFPQS